jgi:hypothetical protein
MVKTGISLGERAHGYHIPSRSFADLPGKLPVTPGLPEGADAVSIAQDWLKSLTSALESNDASSLGDLFIADALWRDQLALTGTLRTFHTSPLVSTALLLRVPAVNATSFTIHLGQPGAPRVVQLQPTLGWVEAGIAFRVSTPAATCSGGFRLILEGGRYKAWTFATVLEQLDSHPELNPYTGQPANIFECSVDGPCPLKARRVHAKPSPARPIEVDVAIFGAGGAGLCVAGRCEGFQLSYIAIDRYAKPGDTWVQRCACRHSCGSEACD